MKTISDLPDYQRYMILQAPPIDVEIGPVNVAEYNDAPEDIADGSRGPILIDNNGRVWVLVDHKRIKGVDLKDPTVEASVPISIENPAIAYNSDTDRFKVDVEKIVEVSADITDDAARLLGIIYGSQSQKVQQKATTYELLTYDSYVAALLAAGLPAALDTGALKIKEQSPLTGFATETTLALIKGYVDGIETLLNGGLPAALDSGALKIKEQSPLTSIKLWDGTYPLPLPAAGDAIGRGAFIYGSDYGSPTPYARIAKVDSSGRLSCILG